MSTRLSEELSAHFKGLKRIVAQAAANGDSQIKTGKDPIPFSLYRVMAREYLSQPSPEYVFGQNYMVMCWNLMCRSSNAVSIKFEHLEWVEDSLCVYFAKMKNDQLGERPRDPKHVYPNPLMPEICPILSLGLYWITYPFGTGNCLYPGSNQYERFRKLLERSSQVEAISRELERRSIDHKDLGSHSMRKGAATYCSSGCTSGPSISAIHLRAGWAMGGVQDRYLRYEAAGDMYVGRVVSGLPLNDPDFDVVGPLFMPGNNALILNSVKQAFPRIPDCLIAIAEKALASLIYHHDFLVRVIHARHPVKQSILFRDRAFVENLKPLVICSLNNRVEIAPTGLPTHTGMLRMLKSVETIASEVPDRTADKIARLMEERSVTAAVVTPAQLEQALESHFQRYFSNRQAASAAEDESPAQEQPAESRTFHWGGRMARLPQDYALPSGTVDTAFRMWMLPDTANRITALKFCTSHDFDGDNKKKRFSDYSKLMKRIETAGRARGIAGRTIEEVDQMISAWEEISEIPTQTPKGRIRRVRQLMWTTVLKISLSE